jgi:hypothetical protein
VRKLNWQQAPPARCNLYIILCSLNWMSIIVFSFFFFLFSFFFFPGVGGSRGGGLVRDREYNPNSILCAVCFCFKNIFLKK